jgi:hypothetical protein
MQVICQEDVVEMAEDEFAKSKSFGPAALSIVILSKVIQKS